MTVEEQVNEDVWHPFRRAYGALDAAAFLAVHSKDLIRAGGPTKTVQGYTEYARQTEEFFGRVAERGDSLSIDFRFVERIFDDERGSERGVFRLVATLADGEERVHYGSFHTYVRKEAGRWRIVADYDIEADEDAFAAGTPLSVETAG